MLGFDPKGQRIGGPRQVGERVIFPPQGRLTLASGVPVMTSNQAGKTVIYWTPSFGGRAIPVWNGRRFEMIDVGGELSNTTTASAVGYAGPAAVTTNKNYDLFGWGRHGKGILSRGAAWNSDTARSSGTENDLELLQGIYVNKNSITNGPPARCGTYLGTVRSDGSSQINWTLGAIASGGTAGVLGVWNMYNRVDVETMVGDSTASWTYNATTWRSANTSATMRVSFVLGLQEDSFESRYHALISSDGSSAGQVAVGYDSTSAFTGVPSSAVFIASTASNNTAVGAMIKSDIGFHFVQALESCQSASSETFYGQLATAAPYAQNGLFWIGRM